MDVSAALVAYPQTAELVQPSQGPLHHPAVHSQPAAVFCTPPSQGRRDVAPVQFLAMPPRVIGPVGVQPLGPATRSAPLTAHWWHSVHQGQQLGYVVAIGPGQDGRQGSLPDDQRQLQVPHEARSVTLARTVPDSDTLRSGWSRDDIYVSRS